MKAVAVAVLIAGVFCNSSLATAEGPVPFRAFMTTAGEPPSVTALNSAQDNSATRSRPTYPTHMTNGGKVMTGVGIGLVAGGGVVIAGTAALNGWETSSDRAGLYGGGIGLAAIGTILIVLGIHRRSAR